MLPQKLPYNRLVGVFAASVCGRLKIRFQDDEAVGWAKVLLLI